MDAKTILKNIKALFSELPAEPAPAPAPFAEPIQVEMKEYSLADGTKVMLDKLEIGGMVTINDLPAPMGEHMLADGTKIQLDEAGVITEIEAAEPAEPVAPVEAAAPVAPVQMRDERVDALKAEVKQLRDGFAQMVALVESLTETPAAEPIEPQKTQFGEVIEAKKSRYKEIQAVLAKHKNK
jgi:hypothetical protein